MKFGVGQSVPRTEDPRLVCGAGTFTDDLNLAGQAYLVMFRSPYAHAVIDRIDVSQAIAMPGVLAALTQADLEGLGDLPCRAQLKNPDGSAAFIPSRPLLARDKVCFVGQPVVAIIAESVEAGLEALEQIDLEVTDLPANANPGLALHPDAPILHEANSSNLCVEYAVGDKVEVDKQIEQCTHSIELDIVNNRVAPSPLEPRACVGEFSDGQYVLHNPSQGVFAQQGVLAKAILRIDPSELRVVSLDTGGGFGIRGEVPPEAALCLYMARQLGRPVKFTGDRSEMFLADAHGRDNLTRVRAGFDADGRCQALYVDTVANLGAYCTAVGPFVPTVAGGRVLGTVYAIAHVAQTVRPVFTNTMPVAAYRGAGRPEAAYVMERLFDAAAQQLNMDAIALRRRNLIQPAQMPYQLPSGVILNCGEFEQTLDQSLLLADWQGFAERAQTSAQQSRLRGRGLAFYVESSGGGPEEEAALTVRADGTVEVVVGTFSHGQGHRTTFAQIVSECLDIDLTDVRIIQGDTDQVRFGGGTGGSRSVQMGGVAALQAAQLVLEQARGIAADLLQRSAADLRYAEGRFTTVSGQASVDLADVARAAEQPQFGGQGLQVVHRYNRGDGYGFPNGCHIAEVEVDPDTGVVEVVRYSSVDDCGRVINPLLATGQVHGGVAMGIGQALYEGVVYDDEGQLLTGSLMDYCIPRAHQLPDFDVGFNEVLEPSNPLGAKGIGEGGACGGPPAVILAVLDALRPLGVAHLDMPLQPESVWRAIRAAE